MNWLKRIVGRLIGGAPKKTRDLHIIFDGPPEHKGGRFIECETPDGISLKTGRWEKVGDYWHLILSKLPERIPGRMEPPKPWPNLTPKWKRAEIQRFKEYIRVVNDPQRPPESIPDMEPKWILIHLEPEDIIK